MSLWGSKDLVGQAGTIAINLSTEAVTGSGTTFNTSGFEVTEGDVIVVGAGATYGQAVISSVSSDTAATIASTQFLIPDPRNWTYSCWNYLCCNTETHINN